MSTVDNVWINATVSRVVPNLLDVRNGLLDIAVAGEPEACVALLHQIGRMIGRPFDRLLPLYVLPFNSQQLLDNDARLAVFDRLFERQRAPNPHRRLLLFLVVAADVVTSRRIDEMQARLAGATGLMVLPELTTAQQRTAIADRLSEIGWLPVFVGQPGKDRSFASARLDTERMARVIHELYLENAWTRGERRGASPALHPWQRLDETYRNANRSQAVHLVCKLAAAGLITSPGPTIADGSMEPIWSCADFIEPLARMEHNRWSSDRILDGWVFGETRDNAARRHPDLIPYEDLSEEGREKDRVDVATIPFVLQLGGFGWRPLRQVRLAGDWPDPRSRPGLRRRWRVDLARIAEERAPAVLEFLLDPSQPNHCHVGVELARFGFPVALCLSAHQTIISIASNATERGALIRCLSLCRRVIWDGGLAQSARNSVALEATVAKRYALHVEQYHRPSQ